MREEGRARGKRDPRLALPVGSGLDEGLRESDVRRALEALHGMRGRRVPLDRQLDAVGSRRAAHVAEEALRRAAGWRGGRGLWRYGPEEAGELVTWAIRWLREGGYRRMP